MVGEIKAQLACREENRAKAAQFRITQELLLEKQAAETAAKYGVGVYIVTVDDYRDIDSSGVYPAAYGIYHTCTTGEGAEYAFTAYGLKQLEESFLPQLGQGDRYGGFRGFIKACDLYPAQAAAANAYLTGELTLTQNSDVFTRRTETRRKLERHSASGSSHAESGSGAGRSGKF